MSAKATVAPRNRNSIREFILSTVFADLQSNVTGKTHSRSFVFSYIGELMCHVSVQRLIFENFLEYFQIYYCLYGDPKF